MNRHDLTIQNNSEELHRMSLFLQDIAAEWNLSQDMLFKLNLASEEVVSNIILHGYEPHMSRETIHIEITNKGDRIMLCFTDQGKAFNPLQMAPPDDLDKQASERKIGGLGLYFIRQLMDEVEYKYENGQNILCLTKYIS